MKVVVDTSVVDVHFYVLSEIRVPEAWGEHCIIWPIRVCAAEQGMVFKVLSLKQGIQFHY